MKTYLNLYVRELATGWNQLVIGRIDKKGRAYYLKDFSGNVISKSTSIEGVADAGRRYAAETGYWNASYCDAA